jgi:glutamate mutase epsilon subunit
MKPANVQKMLSKNRDYITRLHEHIEILRAYKSEADVEGRLEDEYYFHNDLAKARKELAGMVSVQKELKQLLKEI